MMVKSLIAALIAISPAMALAQTPATADTSANPESSHRQRPYGGGRFGAGTFSERETEEATVFMREYAPNRWQVVQALPEEGAVRRGVMGFIVARYRALQDTKRDDPKLYEVKLQQLTAEDDVYGLIASNPTAEARQKHRSELRMAVRKMMDLNLIERELRIERLKRSLAAEEQRLEKDRAQFDAHLDSRVEAFINDGTNALRRDMFPVLRNPRFEGRPTTQPAGR